MKRLLIKLWHRFTLGRTARPVIDCCGTGGSVADVAGALRDAADRTVSIGVKIEIVTRKATDLPPRVVRIVLETSE